MVDRVTHRDRRLAAVYRSGRGRYRATALVGPSGLSSPWRPLAWVECPAPVTVTRVGPRRAPGRVGGRPRLHRYKRPTTRELPTRTHQSEG